MPGVIGNRYQEFKGYPDGSVAYPASGSTQYEGEDRPRHAVPVTVAHRATGMPHAKTGSVTVVQRTSSDLRLNPHLHTAYLEGAYHEDGVELGWQEVTSKPVRSAR